MTARARRTSTSPTAPTPAPALGSRIRLLAGDKSPETPRQDDLSKRERRRKAAVCQADSLCHPEKNLITPLASSVCFDGRRRRVSKPPPPPSKLAGKQNCSRNRELREVSRKQMLRRERTGGTLGERGNGSGRRRPRRPTPALLRQ